MENKLCTECFIDALFIVLAVILTLLVMSFVGCASNKSVQMYKVKCHNADFELRYNVDKQIVEKKGAW